MRSFLLISVFVLSLLSDQINAQVVYTDVNPDLTFTADQMYLLDMDNDSNPDYIIEQVDSLIAGNPLEGVQLRHFPGTNNEAVYETGTLTFLAGLMLNELIDNNQQWTVPSPSLPAGGVIMIGSTPYPAGDWSDGLPHYAGVRFVTNSNTYYGWVRFSVTTDGMGFTIMDYAYRSTPEQPLLAGATVDGVEEENELSFNWNIVNETLFLNAENGNEKLVELFDYTGKIVFSSQWNESLNIDLSAYASGIYFVRNTENGKSETVQVAISR